MKPYQFAPNDTHSIGVEVELQLIDADSMALKSACPAILQDLPAEMRDFVKPELMQCYVEVITKVCHTVSEVEQDLRYKLDQLSKVAARHNTRLFWSGTHPFSSWHDQEITENERYHGLVKLLQDTARRLVTFGLHVHVAVNSGDKAVMICDRILRHLPTLLALSSNSPFWNGRLTGLHSQRSKIMESLPTAGLPPLMRNWSEFVWLVNHLLDTGFISSIREIWWDVRPHYGFGTVEVRICDIPANLEDTLGLVALIQCLVAALSKEIDSGTYQHDCHPMMVRQNKWRACRYGMAANLVDPYTQKPLPARELVRQLVGHLRETAAELKCTDYLDHVTAMTEKPTGAERQIFLFEEKENTADVVRDLVEEE